jgi:nucleoside 2-deoxyribosyltransferase
LIPCDGTRRVLVIGEVFVDRHVDQSLVRLGGLFHVARALHALQTHYAAAYVGPAYLDQECSSRLRNLGAHSFAKIGDVVGAPNIVEIRESTEAGQQGYEDLLREQRSIRFNVAELETLLRDYGPTDILVLSGEIRPQILATLLPPGARLYVDTDHDAADAWSAARLHTVLCSTSGEPFRRCGRDPETLRQHYSRIGAAAVVLKENRGGSRVWTPVSNRTAHEAPAFPTSTEHSVGVGDCFDAVWLAVSDSEPPADRLRAAAYVASIYASTFDHQTFVRDVASVLRSPEIGAAGLTGIRLSWESRATKNIYLAAPDFPDVDTQLLDLLEEAVQYHNFRPRRPVKELGLANSTMTVSERRDLYFRDLELLETCDALIALPLTDDSGTFAELGRFSGTARPSILFDPSGRVGNLFARNVAARTCRSRTEVIDALFELLGSVSDVG